MSVKELVEKAEIIAAYLSQIEGRAREGSVSTMKAIVLNLDLTDLV